MEVMRTLTGVRFQFKWHADGDLIAYPAHRGALQANTGYALGPDAIVLIKGAIRSKRRVHMGASRDNPPPNSLGEFCKQAGISPQWLSYLVPVLIAQGFCDCVKEGSAYVIRYQGG